MLDIINLETLEIQSKIADTAEIQYLTLYIIKTFKSVDKLRGLVKI